MGSIQKYIIVKDRVELYKDFALNLLYYIHNYYIDRETLSEEQDIQNHYVWCFNKVCDEFKLENIDFSKNKELKMYFFSYYKHQFYLAKKNQDISIEFFEKFWKNIFEIEKQKNKTIINILIEIYNIYDKSINQEKNILEIV